VLKEWKHVLLFSSRDHEFTQTLANRIIELTPDGIIDKHMSYDEYLADDTVKATQAKMYFK
jgi:ATPase subunit of ABC transporter with duplicated ATPase domains